MISQTEVIAWVYAGFWAWVLTSAPWQKITPSISLSLFTKFLVATWSHPQAFSVGPNVSVK